MKPLLVILIAFMFLSKDYHGQITLDNVSRIYLTDMLNINYEKVNTFNFEIRFNDSIELWHTKQISRAEFQQEVFKAQSDSIYNDYYQHKELYRDSLTYYYTKIKNFTDQAYQNYSDTVQPVFIKYIPSSVIANLLQGIQDTTYSHEDFKSQQYNLSDIEYGNETIMTSYYPLIGMTVASSVGDTLIIYNDGQQDLMLPWYRKDLNRQLYNPLINWSLDAIIPEDLNYNKGRLTEGLMR